jgi:hypothetical protein
MAAKSKVIVRPVRPGRNRPKSIKSKSKRKPRVSKNKKGAFPTPASLVKMQKFPKGSPWAVSGALLI